MTAYELFQETTGLFLLDLERDGHTPASSAETIRELITPERCQAWLEQAKLEPDPEPAARPSQFVIASDSEAQAEPEAPTPESDAGDGAVGDPSPSEGEPSEGDEGAAAPTEPPPAG